MKLGVSFMLAAFLVACVESSPSTILRRQDIALEDRFVFARLDNVTTCQLAGFQWIFTERPRSSPLTLTASNRGVPQTNRDAYSGDISRIIFTNIEAGISGIDWPVDLPPGTYRIEGFVPSLNLRNQSPPFEILAGSDLSCIPELRATSSSAPTGSTASTPIPEPSSTIIAVPSVVPVDSEIGRISVGTIAGAAVGALTAVILIVVAVFFLVRRRRSAAKRQRQPRGFTGLFPYFVGFNTSDEPPPYAGPPPIGGVAPYFAGPADGSSGTLGVKAFVEDGSTAPTTSENATLRTKRPLPHPPTYHTVNFESSTLISSSATGSS